MYRYIIAHHWGDFASLIGLWVSVIGFVVTYVNVRRAKSAAQQAEAAVEALQDTLRKMDTVVELAATSSLLEELKTLHRTEASWDVLLDRYSFVRRRLRVITTTYAHFSPEQVAMLEEAVAFFSNLEDVVDRASQSQRVKLNKSKFNKAVTEQIDRLDALLIHIKQNAGD